MANVLVSTISNSTSTGYFASQAYFTCSTAASTAAKVATRTISGDSLTFTDTSLVAGMTIHVKFSNSNTAANPTLKVGTSTAKSIKIYGSTAPGVDAAHSWNAGAVVTLTYDGTYWVMDSATYDFQSSTYYGTISGVTNSGGTSTITLALSNGSITTPSVGTVVVFPTTSSLTQFWSESTYAVKLGSGSAISLKYKGTSNFSIPQDFNGRISTGTLLEIIYDGTSWNLVNCDIGDFRNFKTIVYCEDLELINATKTPYETGIVYTYTVSTTIPQTVYIKQFALGEYANGGLTDTIHADLFTAIGGNTIIVSGGMLNGYYINTTKTRWGQIAITNSGGVQSLTCSVAVKSGDSFVEPNVTGYLRVWYTLS